MALRLVWNRNLAFILLLSIQALASQSGPVFPTHRYPTDQSMHLSYSYGLLYTAENYIESQVTEPLPNASKIKRNRHTIGFEYQPDRSLSAGFIFNYDKISLSNDVGSPAEKSGLSDQRIFGEYRFYDKPGASIGGAIIVKFPLYSNPTYQSLQNSRASSVALLGDAQSDFSFLLTSEFWFVDNLRLRTDLGYTYRTEHYSGEFPFMGSVAYVSPRLDLDIKIAGNLSQKNDDFNPTTSEVDQVRALFGSSEYAYAKDPWVLFVNPTADIWLNKLWAFSVDYKQSLMGQNSPAFWEVRAGLIYRWASNAASRRRKVKEVDIDTDQEEGNFPGEKTTKAIETNEELSSNEDTGGASENSAEPKVIEEQIPEDEEN